MGLIAILFCLALQRFANVGGWFKASWFEFYFRKVSQFASKLNEWLIILATVAPVIIVLAILHFLFMWRLFGLFNLVLAVVVLFLFIDARDLKNQLAGYFANSNTNDLQAATTAASELIGESSFGSIQELRRAVSKALLLKSFERVFSGLFWFMVFGVYGITTYCMIVLIRQNALKVDSGYAGLTKLASEIQDALDWIPSRLVGFSFALAGNFSKGFSYCAKYLWMNLADVKTFVVDAGLASIDADQDITKTEEKENTTVLDLINRSLIIWLLAMALIMIGVWF